MRRILVTGMSGTGKSSVIGELAARGYWAVDADSDDYRAGPESPCFQAGDEWLLRLTTS
jgi:hypothetical protein